MRKATIVLLATLALGACGYRTGDRAVSGGLLGADAAARQRRDAHLGRPAWR